MKRLIDGVEVRPIPGYGGYLASKDGRIWSDKTSRWLAAYTEPGGYQQVVLRRDGRSNSLRVHRLVLESFVGPCPEGMECRHLDGNPSNNQLPNICWGTVQENHCDRLARSGDYGVIKLSSQDVNKIRNDYSEGGCTQLGLADKWGVTVRHIARIINNERWKRVVI